jgi:tripartite-type tricarboxylate transporter receptor subunit TctC
MAQQGRLPDLRLVVDDRDGGRFDRPMRALAIPAQKLLETRIQIVNVESGAFQATVQQLSAPGAMSNPLPLVQMRVSSPSKRGATPNPDKLSPIRQVASAWYAAVTLASAQWKTLLEWLNYSASPPRSYGAVLGSAGHSAMEKMATDRRLALHFIPLLSEDARKALVDQQCEIALVEDWAPYKNNPDFKFLNVLSERRVIISSLPTARESGLNVVAGETYGIVGPEGLPSEIAARLDQGFGMAAAEGLHLEALAQADLTPAPLDREAYAEALRRAFRGSLEQHA